MDSAAEANREAGERWWQDWRWIAAIAALLFAIGFAAFVGVSIGTTSETNEVVLDLQPIIERLDRNQEGIDSLVQFVEDAQAQDSQGEAVQLLVDVLCASSDPVRIEACEQLQNG